MTAFFPVLNAGLPLSALAAVIVDFLQIRQEKLRPVAEATDEGAALFHLFSTRQARPPGRRTDFTGMLRLGGMVVPADEIPEYGCFEMTRPLPDGPPTGRSADRVWQWLRTDGRRWQAWVRDESDGAWRLREWFDLEPVLASLPEADASDDHPRRAFGEFLNRALLSWGRREEPEELARFLASHAREAADALLQNKADRVEAWARSLHEQVGVRVDDPASAASLLTAMRVLALLPWAQPRYRGVHAICPPELEQWLVVPGGPRAPWDEFIRYAVSAVHHFSLAEDIAHRHELRKRERLRDRNLLDLCLTFWREVSGKPSRPGDASTPEHRAQAERQIRDLGHVFPLAPGHRPTVLDLNAGHGDYPLAWLHQLPEGGKPPHLVACEAHPLGWMITQFRLAVAAEAMEWRDSEPLARVHWRNTFRDGPPNMERADIILGETRPHLGPDLKLALVQEPTESEYAAHGWGSLTKNGDLAANRYLEMALRDLKPSAASLRLPASWADEEENESARAALLAGVEPLYVNAEAAGPRPKDKRLARGDVILMAVPKALSAESLPEGYARAEPREENGFSLMAASGYFEWPSLTDLALRTPLNGPVERRGMALIDIDKEALDKRMRAYFGDPSDAGPDKKFRILLSDTKSPKHGTITFHAAEVREQLKRQTNYNPRRMERYSFRPFDDRWLYRHEIRPLFSEPANELFLLAGDDNAFLVVREGQAHDDDGPSAWWGRLPCDYDFFVGRSGHFPVWVYEKKPPRRRRAMLSVQEADAMIDRVANLSQDARAYLKRLGYPAPDKNPEVARKIWLHAQAVMHTPGYRRENRDALRHGWPRIPLPGFGEKRLSAQARERAREQLEASARLGQQIADLLTGATPTDPELQNTVAVLKIHGCPTTPEIIANDDDPALLALTAGWGASAKGKRSNLTRAREGKTTLRPYTEAEKAALTHAAQRQGIPPHEWPDLLGTQAVDVHLNDNARWTGIPEKAWTYAIAGRQILPKWLSYREQSILNRPLSAVECRIFAETAHRLAVLLLLSSALDKVRPCFTHNTNG